MHFFSSAIEFDSPFLSAISAAHPALSQSLFLFCSDPPHFLVLASRVDCFFLSETETTFLLRNLPSSYTFLPVHFFSSEGSRLATLVADFVTPAA